jgi:hypothetical protein
MVARLRPRRRSIREERRVVVVVALVRRILVVGSGIRSLDVGLSEGVAGLI